MILQFHHLLTLLIVIPAACLGAISTRRQLPTLHYSIRLDRRRCSYPLCGGYWIKALNRNRTKCFDGTFNDECYIFKLDATVLGPLDADRFVQEMFDGDIVFGSQVFGQVAFNTTTVANLKVEDGWKRFERSPSAKCYCNKGELCIYDPAIPCDGCDCPTICLPKPGPLKCSGPLQYQCPKGLSCIDDPLDKCSAECGGTNCPGVCVSMPTKSTSCGGFAGLPCSSGTSCYDNPKDSCNPLCGGADCGGICVQQIGAFCGGLKGFTCGPGLQCVEPLGDGCDNRCGGADCGGVCIPVDLSIWK